MTLRQLSSGSLPVPLAPTDTLGHAGTLTPTLFAVLSPVASSLISGAFPRHSHAQPCLRRRLPDMVSVLGSNLSPAMCENLSQSCYKVGMIVLALPCSQGNETVTTKPLWQRVHKWKLCWPPVPLKLPAAQTKWAKSPFLFSICHGHVSVQSAIKNKLLEKLN